MIVLKKIEKRISKRNLKTWVSWLNDKKITKYSEQRLKKHTIKSQLNFIKKKIESKNSFLYKIIHNTNFVGILEIGYINNYHKNCELMYMIGERSLWGQGMGSAAVKLGLEICFNKYNIKKVYAGTYAKNVASQKVLLKNNFKIEGIQKKFFHINNMRMDRVILGIQKK